MEYPRGNAQFRAAADMLPGERFSAATINSRSKESTIVGKSACSSPPREFGASLLGIWREAGRL
ncbi:MAG: hypothetical protein ACLSUW_04680 [Akkermansia sp.]